MYLITSKENALFYANYRLTGSAQGDEISRMINGVQANPHFTELLLKFHYDPLYRINYQDSSGHFVPESRTLFIGPHVIAGEFAGFNTTLRHEIQHYFEEIKVIDGKMSLARVSFSEHQQKQDIPYGDFLNVDELETHLRDLRALKNAQKLTAKDKKIVGSIGAEKFESVKSARASMILFKANVLKVLIQNSRIATANLASSGNWSAVSLNPVTGGIEVLYQGMNPPYSMALVKLRGLLPAGVLAENAQIKAEVEKVLKWQKARIDQIEAEFNKLEQK